MKIQYGIDQDAEVYGEVFVKRTCSRWSSREFGIFEVGDRSSVLGTAFRYGVVRKAFRNGGQDLLAFNQK
jgi:hypothetical protein